MATTRNRVVFLCPDNLLVEIEEYAESMAISRSSAILVLINQSLKSNKAMSDLNDIVKLAQKFPSEHKDNDK